MTSLDLATWLAFAILVLFLNVAWELYRNAVIYATRQELFEIRDRVFYLHVEHGLPLDSKGHKDLRNMLNWMIRWATMFGPLTIFTMSYLSRRAKRSGVKFTDFSAHLEAVATGQAQTRILTAGMQEAIHALRRGAMRRSVPLVPILRLNRLISGEFVQWVVSILDRQVTATVAALARNDHPGCQQQPRHTV